MRLKPQTNFRSIVFALHAPPQLPLFIFIRRPPENRKHAHAAASVMAPKTVTDAGPSRPLSRHERRHGTKQREAPEPTIQVPKVYIYPVTTIT